MPIKVEALSHSYQAGTPFEKQVLFNIDLDIKDGEFLGLIGPTQAGKTSLAQHFNALIIPKVGRVLIDGRDTADRKTDLLSIRHQVGYVFQNPDHQLFKTTVGEDIAFGPVNQKCQKAEVEKRVREAMDLVGLDYYKFFDRDILTLSGGQKRRAAIAGVLACYPKVLVLDNVTSGLDPWGREEIMSVIKKLHRLQKLTIVLISNSMDDVARLAERIVVMHNGRILMDGETRSIFTEADRLREVGLEIPQIPKIMHRLKQNGFIVPVDLLDIDEATEAIVTALVEAGVEKSWS